MSHTASSVHAHIYNWERMPMTIKTDNRHLRAEPISGGMWAVECRTDGQVQYTCVMTSSKMEAAMEHVMQADGREFNVVNERDDSGYCVGVVYTAKPVLQVGSRKATSMIGNFLKKIAV